MKTHKVSDLLMQLHVARSFAPFHVNGWRVPQRQDLLRSRVMLDVIFVTNCFELLENVLGLHLLSNLSLPALEEEMNVGALR